MKRGKAQVNRGRVQGSLNFKGENRNLGNPSEPGQNHRADPPFRVDRNFYGRVYKYQFPEEQPKEYGAP